MFFCFKFLARRWNWFAKAKCWLLLIFWNTDWRNCNNLKKFLHTIFTLSELVLSFVEMKANENVLHRDSRRFLEVDCDEREIHRDATLYFFVSSLKFYSHDCHPERSRRLMKMFYTELHGDFLKWIVMRELEKGKGIFLMEMI